MERVGLPGRIMLIMMAALLVMIGVTAAIDHLSSGAGLPPSVAPFPRVVHAAGIIALIRGADAMERRDIIVAANTTSVHVSIVDTPAAGADDIRSPYHGRRLLRMIGDPGANLEAYTERHPVRVGYRPLTRAILRLENGSSLVIEWVTPPSAASFRLLGLPPSAWAGILGFAVAGLALVTALREVRPLKMLTETVTRFDGGQPVGSIEEKGAPDVRRLVRAVHGMQERVAGLLAERSFLIGAISHDLRTYLTRLRLRTESVGDDEARERMVGDLDAMTRLIDTSLAFARGTTISQSRASLDLSDLVAVEVEEHKALGLPVTFHATYASDAVVVGDPLALRRVVCNVLDNAQKFARGNVTVRVEHAVEYERIVIQDDGPGIPEAECRSVFSPFYRVERSRSRSTGGTGLGLAIARQIVEAHAGTIEAGAARPRGAVFTIQLPAARARHAR